MSVERFRCGRNTMRGNPCPNFVKREGAPCYAHGGKTGAHLTLVGNEELARRAKELIEERTGVPVVVTPVWNPLEALAEFAGEVVAWKDLLREKVDALKVWRFEDDKGGEQLRSEIAVFERALDRTLNVLVAVGRLNVEARLLRVEEKQTAIIVRAVEAGLRQAGVCGSCGAPVTEDVLGKARGRVITELRVASGK